jgi:hypothetical protein
MMRVQYGPNKGMELSPLPKFIERLPTQEMKNHAAVIFYAMVKCRCHHHDDDRVYYMEVGLYNERENAWPLYGFGVKTKLSTVEALSIKSEINTECIKGNVQTDLFKRSEGLFRNQHMTGAIVVILTPPHHSGGERYLTSPVSMYPSNPPPLGSLSFHRIESSEDEDEEPRFLQERSSKLLKATSIAPKHQSKKKNKKKKKFTVDEVRTSVLNKPQGFGWWLLSQLSGVGQTEKEKAVDEVLQQANQGSSSYE